MPAPRARAAAAAVGSELVVVAGGYKDAAGLAAQVGFGGAQCEGLGWFCLGCAALVCRTLWRSRAKRMAEAARELSHHVHSGPRVVRLQRQRQGLGVRLRRRCGGGRRLRCRWV